MDPKDGQSYRPPLAEKVEAQEEPSPWSVSLSGPQNAEPHDFSFRAQLWTFQRFISWPVIPAIEIPEIIKAGSVRFQAFQYRGVHGSSPVDIRNSETCRKILCI